MQATTRTQIKTEAPLLGSRPLAPLLGSLVINNLVDNRTQDKPHTDDPCDWIDTDNLSAWYKPDETQKEHSVELDSTHTDEDAL